MKLKTTFYLAMFVVLRVHAQEDTTLVPEEEKIPATFADTKGKYEPMWRINKAVEYPIIFAFGGTSIYMMSKVIYSKSKTPDADVLRLSKDDVPEFDRWNAGWTDKKLDDISYYPFYAVMPLPLLFLADKRMKKDRGQIGVLYLEAFAFEGIIYTGAVHFFDRFRPEVYNTSLPLDYRTNGNFRNSFFAGHVAVVANTTFFMSSVYMAYHPHSKLKWVLYGGSAAATLGMSYMRFRAGKHFVSDIVTGIVVGVGCGLLTPALHKNRSYKDKRWSLAPDMLDNGKGGFTFTYKL